MDFEIFNFFYFPYFKVPMEQNPKQNPEQITLKIEQWVKNLQDYYHNKK